MARINAVVTGTILPMSRSDNEHIKWSDRPWNDEFPLNDENEWKKGTTVVENPAATKCYEKRDDEN